jgi:hypothetical protein
LALPHLCTRQKNRERGRGCVQGQVVNVAAGPVDVLARIRQPTKAVVCGHCGKGRGERWHCCLTTFFFGEETFSRTPISFHFPKKTSQHAKPPNNTLPMSIQFDHNSAEGAEVCACGHSLLNAGGVLEDQGRRMYAYCIRYQVLTDADTLQTALDSKPARELFYAASLSRAPSTQWFNQMSNFDLVTRFVNMPVKTFVKKNRDYPNAEWVFKKRVSMRRAANRSFKLFVRAYFAQKRDEEAEKEAPPRKKRPLADPRTIALPESMRKRLRAGADEGHEWVLAGMELVMRPIEATDAESV